LNIDQQRILEQFPITEQNNVDKLIQIVHFYLSP